MPLTPQADACLTFSCTKRRAANCKGLCMTCWSKARKIVESGKVTWERLAELGMIESEKTPFEAELERRLNAANEADRKPG